MDYDADAIVIGAGHNGLVCATQLARRGWKVLVVERNDQPGGAARSAQVTLPGFCHDLYATNVGLFLGSAFYQQHAAAMQQAGFEPVVSDHAYASVFPDGQGLGITTDVTQNRHSITAINAQDADSWSELTALFRRTAPAFLPLMQMPMPSLRAARQLWSLYRTLRWSGAQQLGQLLLQSPRGFVDSWFQSDEMKALIAPWAFHLDFGPDIANGAMFPFIESVLNAANGIAITRGGISHLPEAIVQLLQQQRGELLTGKAVDRILVHKGRARGVALADGSTLYAKRAVIGNVTPTQLISRLLPAATLPDSYVRKCHRYRYGPGTMMLHLALSEPLQWQAGEQYSRFSYVHIGPYVSDLAQTYTDALNGKLPDEPMLVVGQPTVVDSQRAPIGQHVLWVQVRALPAIPRKGTTDGKVAAGHWDDIKWQYADRVIDKIACYAPNIHQALLERAVLSPVDLEASNPNLVGGDSVAGSHHLDQNYLFRPFAGWSRYRTPIKGLYLVGAATWPGGGLNATSGDLLATLLS